MSSRKVRSILVSFENIATPASLAVSAREAGVAMFSNETRMLLTFREDMLGRARVFQGLELAEDQMRATSACRSASWSREIGPRSRAEIVRPALPPETS